MDNRENNAHTTYDEYTLANTSLTYSSNFTFFIPNCLKPLPMGFKKLIFGDNKAIFDTR